MQQQTFLNPFRFMTGREIAMATQTGTFDPARLRQEPRYMEQERKLNALRVKAVREVRRGN